MLNTKALTWSVGLFGAGTFVLCILYGLLVPESLHMDSALAIVLPGFRWLTVAGFLIGLLESFLYGAYAGLVVGWLYNGFARRWGLAPAAPMTQSRIS